MVELQEKQQRIQQFRTDAQKDLADKEADLFKPIQEAAMKAINEVAKAQGYQYVLDRATLIVADGDDILADVKKQMGI
jgi:outer membrane protein